ncbi:unnamed protein product [Moneuplotes crassus]|uniref:Peptidase A1 domain-containing protein n=1 Tax=Euplotes crassus TaxID=5936 RepID=A0AAD1U8U4_EUPCR|nr:unnamed protein product [Moneuplotes crassus]
MVKTHFLLVLCALVILSLSRTESTVAPEASQDTENQTTVTTMGTYIKFENYSSILLANSKLLNEEDSDSQFYERGEFSFDYIVKVNIGKDFFNLKLDLTSEIPFVSDISCKTCLMSKKYFADFSNSASKITEYDSLCSIYKDDHSSNGGFIENEECQFFHDNKELEIRYNGFLSKDKVFFSPEYTLGSQTVGRIVSQYKNFIFKGTNGFLGIGPSSYQSLFNPNTERVFSLCSNHEKEGGGYLVVGGVDNNMMKGEINWVPYSSYLHYNIPIQELSIGKVSISGNLEGIIDTKYEFIIVDNYVLNNIKREVKSVMCREDSAYVNVTQLCSLENNILDGNPLEISQISSDFLTEMPPFVINLKNLMVKFEISQYIVPCNEVASLKLDQVEHSKRMLYYCPIITSKFNALTNKVYLGSKFLKNYYVIIDKQKARIGFAQKAAQNCIPSGKISHINTISYLDSCIEYLAVSACLILFFCMVSECIDFYDIEDDGNTSMNTSEQSSQAGTFDQRQQAEELNMEEIKNNVEEAIQYTQNEDGTLRVINGISVLVQDIKNKEHVD